MATEVEMRMDIADLLSKYAQALDTRDWVLLASCFEQDAWADYGRLGGRQEGNAAIVAYCRTALEPLAPATVPSAVRVMPASGPRSCGDRSTAPR